MLQFTKYIRDEEGLTTCVAMNIYSHATSSPCISQSINSNSSSLTFTTNAFALALSSFAEAPQTVLETPSSAQYSERRLARRLERDVLLPLDQAGCRANADATTSMVMMMMYPRQKVLAASSSATTGECARSGFAGRVVLVVGLGAATPS